MDRKMADGLVSWNHLKQPPPSRTVAVVNYLCHQWVSSVPLAFPTLHCYFSFKDSCFLGGTSDSTHWFKDPALIILYSLHDFFRMWRWCVASSQSFPAQIYWNGKNIFLYFLFKTGLLDSWVLQNMKKVSCQYSFDHLICWTLFLWMLLFFLGYILCIIQVS